MKGENVNTFKNKSSKHQQKPKKNMPIKKTIYKTNTVVNQKQIILEVLKKKTIEKRKTNSNKSTKTPQKYQQNTKKHKKMSKKTPKNTQKTTRYWVYHPFLGPFVSGKRGPLLGGGRPLAPVVFSLKMFIVMLFLFLFVGCLFYLFHQKNTNVYNVQSSGLVASFLCK